MGGAAGCMRTGPVKTVPDLVDQVPTMRESATMLSGVCVGISWASVTFGIIAAESRRSSRRVFWRTQTRGAAETEDGGDDGESEKAIRGIGRIVVRDF